MVANTINFPTIADKARKSVRGYEKDAIAYLNKDKDLSAYLSASAPISQRERNRSLLEDKVAESIAKYDQELHGMTRKSVKYGAMGLAIANDLYALASPAAPFLGAAGLGYVLFGISTIAELPALYRYIKKSGDWYGAAVHVALKPLRYLIPIVGPALEAGAFERMVKRKAIKEAKYNFLREIGKYTSAKELVREKLEQPIHEAIELPMAA